MISIFLLCAIVFVACIINNSSSKYKLFIISDSLRSYYEELSQKNTVDSGLDLCMPKDIIIPANAHGFKIPLGISCAPTTKHGYYLYPRSSLSNTPLRMANSVGIIDSSYRGEIIASVDNISNEDYHIMQYDNDTKKRTRLFQLCSPNLKPFKFFLVNKLDNTSRGSGGFGSTNY